MKKYLSRLMAIIIISQTMCIMACTEKSKFDLTAKLQNLQKAESRYNNLDSAEQEKAFLADADSLFRDLKAGVRGYNTAQGLCAQSDWAISLPQCEGAAEGFLSKAQDLYNSVSAFNAIYSDYEIWVRHLMTEEEPLVDSISIVHSIKSLDPGCIQDKCMQDAVKKYRNGIVWCIIHLNEWDDDRNPQNYCDMFMKCMADNYLNKKGGDVYLDTEKLYKLEELDVDSVETARFVKNWKNNTEWWKELIENKDFNNRIKLTLQAAHVESGLNRWENEVMMTLMQSEQYSPLLPRLWRSWRCCCQAIYCGYSRDSYIQNYLYNRYRKMVFTTIINHIIDNPSDKQAILCAQYVLVQSNMIRNGNFIAGNDCMLELSELGLSQW